MVVLTPGSGTECPPAINLADAERRDMLTVYSGFRSMSICKVK